MARRTDLGGTWMLTGNAPWDDGVQVGPHRAPVPGSVSGALESEGALLPLWSPAELPGREWIARRVWIYERTFTLPEEPQEGRSERYYLHLRVIGQGYAQIDGQTVGVFAGPWREAVLDITAQVEMGGEHRLAVVIEHSAAGDEALPRTGILSAAVRSCAFGRILSLRARGENETIGVHTQMEGFTAGRVIFRYRVLFGGELVASHEAQERLIAANQSFDHSIAIENPRRWHIAGCGDRPLYTVRLTVERGGTRCDSEEFSAAFPAYDQRQVPGAVGTLSYAAFDDGRPVFLRGMQCSPPIEPDALRILADAGANLIRFGGNMPPSDEVFALCDELGILAWQELPFHGGEPPVENGAEYAADMAGRLANHPSAAYLSSGRNLSWPDGSPVGMLHPAVAAIREAARAACPWLTFLPASPSGPVMGWRGYTSGLRHDTQGPLTIPQDLAEINIDDSLFTTVGVPAPQFWPDDRADWRKLEGGAIHKYEKLFGPFLPEHKGAYLRLGRFMQSEWARYLIGAARARFPRNAGVNWHRGNMPCPVAASHAMLDWNGSERPALGGFKRMAGRVAVAVELEKLYYYRGEKIEAKICLLAEPSDEKLYRVEARLTDMRGNALVEKTYQARGGGDVTGEISHLLEAGAPETVLLWLQVFDGYNPVFRDTWTISVPREGEPPLAPLRRLPKAVPALSVMEDKLVLTNDGPEALLGLTLYAGNRIIYTGAMLPWEAREMPVDSSVVESLRIEALNI